MHLHRLFSTSAFPCIIFSGRAARFLAEPPPPSTAKDSGALLNSLMEAPSRMPINGSPRPRHARHSPFHLRPPLPSPLFASRRRSALQATNPRTSRRCEHAPPRSFRLPACMYVHTPGINVRTPLRETRATCAQSFDRCTNSHLSKLSLRCGPTKRPRTLACRFLR